MVPFLGSPFPWLSFPGFYPTRTEWVPSVLRLHCPCHSSLLSLSTSVSRIDPKSRGLGTPGNIPELDDSTHFILQVQKLVYSLSQTESKIFPENLTTRFLSNGHSRPFGQSFNDVIGPLFSTNTKSGVPLTLFTDLIPIESFLFGCLKRLFTPYFTLSFSGPPVVREIGDLGIYHELLINKLLYSLCLLYMCMIFSDRYNHNRQYLIFSLSVRMSLFLSLLTLFDGLYFNSSWDFFHVQIHSEILTILASPSFYLFYVYF